MSGLIWTNRTISRRQFLIGIGASASTSAFAFGSPTVTDVRLTIQQGVVELDHGYSAETTIYAGRPNVLRPPAGIPIRVQLHNQTQETEYVHWHGFVVPARYDGTCEEESRSLAPGERLTYTLPAQAAGLYYAHSHAMTMHSLLGGPYSGQFVPVLVGDGGVAEIRFDAEVFLASHEWGGTFFDQDGMERSAEQMHHLRIDADDEEDEGGGGGWEIRYRAASLAARPLGVEPPIKVRHGQRVLFHIVNASATEPLTLHLPGHSFLVHTLDGHRVPVAGTVETLSLGVGERVSAVVLMDNPGCWIMGSTDDRARAMGMGVVIEYDGSQREPVWSAPARGTEVPDYAVFALASVDNRAVDAVIRLERRPKDRQGFEQWTMVWTGDSSPVVDEPFRIAIENATNENHPIHLHRQSFELKFFGGRSLAGLRKDTVVVPAFQRVAFEFTPADDEPSLLHCHNQMHMDCGMKILLQATHRRRT
jgi:FtsP/CotA-like multicopper oxidase with cupredoxin domain